MDLTLHLGSPTDFFGSVLEDSGRVLFYASALISFFSVVRGHLNLVSSRNALCRFDLDLDLDLKSDLFLSAVLGCV